MRNYFHQGINSNLCCIWFPVGHMCTYCVQIVQTSSFSKPTWLPTCSRNWMQTINESMNEWILWVTDWLHYCRYKKAHLFSLFLSLFLFLASFFFISFSLFLSSSSFFLFISPSLSLARACNALQLSHLCCKLIHANSQALFPWEGMPPIQHDTWLTLWRYSRYCQSP